MSENILLCVDRDGTLIYDEDYYLGKDNYWKEKVKLMPKVVEGMKLFDSKFPKACRFIITNQPGVAIKDFKRLTIKRAQKITKEITHILKRNGAYFDGFIVCPHVTPEYQKSHKQYSFDKKYVDSKCKCFKPETGMIEEAAEKKKLNLKTAKIYVIGDRKVDVLTALNAGGTGILIPFKNSPKEEDELKKLMKLKKNKGKIFIAKNFLNAINIIIEKECTY